MLVGYFDLDAAGELQRQLHLWHWSEGSIRSANRAGRFIRTQSVGALPSSWQCVGMDGRLLARQLLWSAFGWVGVDVRGAVVTVSFAAVPGTSIRGSSARPSASGTPPTAGKTSL